MIELNNTVKLGTIIDSDLLDTLIAEHHDTFGDGSYPKFVDQTIEEMSELSQALLKVRRKVKYNETFLGSEDNFQKAVDEEIADVLICLECLMRDRDIDSEDIKQLVQTKLKKWAKNRLNA
jgi:NTP pyrophosphatase (non-canonical NTP hydrolase)